MARNSESHDSALHDLREAIVADYRADTPKSLLWFERASKSLVAGVTGNLRYFDPYPIYSSTGDGSRIEDVDGNSYVDSFLCNGPLLLGHRHPSVMSAIEESRRSIGSLVINPPLAGEVAEEILDCIPSADAVRFLNSGTEAVMAAVRFARAFTGRSKIVKFQGHYHGMDDQLLFGMGAISIGAVGGGIPSTASQNTIVLPYGDHEALSSAFANEGEIAAVILDPAMHNGGLWGSTREYLDFVRSTTQSYGTLLIFDEVITGFRLGLGGAQDYYGVVPDLTTLGKALAAGEKLSAVAGRSEVMRSVDPTARLGRQTAFQSGTGNDGTAALASAKAAITEYRAHHESGGYEVLHRKARTLADGILDAFEKASVPCQINQLGPMLQMFLTDDEADFRTFSQLNQSVLNLYFLSLLHEGALLTLPGSNHIYLSFAHTDEDIETLINATSSTLARHDFRRAWEESTVERVVRPRDRRTATA